jgi:broad specificity phosphatase PhoE
MASTVFLVRHAKAAKRANWDGPDRDRPLVRRGKAQAERLALVLAPERPVLLAASPWLRCVETAEPLAAAVGIEVRRDARLGYDGPDLEGWMREMAAEPGEAVVGVGHGDLIPHSLLRAGLLRGVPAFRTGSLFRVRLGEGRPVEVTYVDRDDLEVSANGRASWGVSGEQPSRRGGP